MLAAGVVLILIRRVVGDALIDSLTTIPANRDAAHAIWWVATERLAAANITVVTVGLLLLVGTWFAGPGRRATTSRKNLTPYLRDPAVAYGTYAAIVLLLLVWAPVPAASDPLTAFILIASGCDRDRGAAAACRCASFPITPSAIWAIGSTRASLARERPELPRPRRRPLRDATTTSNDWPTSTIAASSPTPSSPPRKRRSSAA